MEEGFRERAERVLDLLGAPDTAYVLVAAPRRESVEEATSSPGGWPRATSRSPR